MNIVHLSGFVSDVTSKEFSWGLAVQLKFEQEGFRTYIDVGNIKKGDNSLDRVQALKGKHVALEAKLKSRKGKPSEQYPDPKTWYSVATSPGGAKAVSQALTGWGSNSCCFAGKILEARDVNGTHFLKVGISFFNPSAQDYGQWEVRVKCVQGLVPPTEGSVVVVGTVYADNGVAVEATQVFAP